MLKTVLGFPRIYTYRETSDFSTRANGPVGGPGMRLKPPCTQSRMVSAAFSGSSRSTSRCAQARRRYGPARAHYQASDDTATAFIRCKNGQAGVAVSCGVLGRRVELREPRHRYPWVAAFQPAGEKFVRLGKGRHVAGRAVRRPTAGVSQRIALVRRRYHPRHRATVRRRVGAPYHGDTVRGTRSHSNQGAGG